MTGHPDVTGTPSPPLPALREAVQRWRLVVAREPVAPEQVRSIIGAWDAALSAAGLPVAGLDRSPPKPRFAIAAPLAARMSGDQELVDVWLVERVPRWRIREALAGGLPREFRLVDLFDVWLGEPALPGQVTASVYRVRTAPGSIDAGVMRSAVRDMLAAGRLPRTRAKGDATVAYDLRPFIADLEAVTTGGTGTGPDAVELRMTLRHDPETGVGRPDEVLAELGERIGVPLPTESLARVRLVLGDAPDPATRRPR